MQYPNWILSFDFFIWYAKFWFKKLLNDFRFKFAKSNIEKSCLLCNKPLSKFLISAIGESANEVRNIVVLFEFYPIFKF